jgi:hypothetical protein
VATAYERRPGTIPGYDWKAAARATRRFWCDVAPDNIRPGGPVISGLPVMNEPHPSILGARVDAIEAIPMDGKKDMCEVDVLYSTNRSFSFPTQPLDPTQIGFQSLSGTFEEFTTRIEVAKKIVLTVPSPSGGAPVTETAWAYGENTYLDVLESRDIWTLRLSLSNFTASMRGLIREQVNKIHELQDGNYYRFEGADVTQTTQTAWECRYTWIGDTGTKAVDLVNASPVQNGPIIYPPGSPGQYLFRAPFGQWKAIHPTVPTPTGYPFFVQCFPYEEALNGWQTLPGIS